MWFFKSFSVKNSSSQSLQWNGFFPSWTDPWCFFKSDSLVKLTLKMIALEWLLSFINWFNMVLQICKRFKSCLTIFAREWFNFFIAVLMWQRCYQFGNLIHEEIVLINDPDRGCVPPPKDTQPAQIPTALWYCWAGPAHTVHICIA